jgi:hypothetical protein
MGLRTEHRQHKGLNNRAENSHLPTRRREQIMKRFKSPRQVQTFLSIHDQVANLFHFPRNRLSANAHRTARAAAFDAALLIVGDIDQLPSVGPGQVLADIIGSGAAPGVRSTTTVVATAWERTSQDGPKDWDLQPVRAAPDLERPSVLEAQSAQPERVERRRV